MNVVWNEIGKEIWADEAQRIRREERKEGRKEGREEGCQGLRTAIGNAIKNRFDAQSRLLTNRVKQVHDIDQLNAILDYASWKATSLADVVDYVGAMR